MNVYLMEMTRNMMHAFFAQFEFDPATAGSGWEQAAYIYEPAKVDQYYDKHKAQGKLHFAIMLDESVIGDIYLKHIDWETRSCEMGIHIVNDLYKGMGYGTQAEQLMLQYAFQTLNMSEVHAETLISNARSRHVLEKAGFEETDRTDNKCHFVCRRND